MSDWDTGYEEGVYTASRYVDDYLNSLLDSGRLDANETRLVENILEHLENALDPDSL